jgi:D-sedoheptulose 7-phosphate isomerase
MKNVRHTSERGGAAVAAEARPVVVAPPARPEADPTDFAACYLASSASVLRALPAADIGALVELLRAARDAKRCVFLCGNGGSAATASHFAAGLGKDASWGRPRRFRAVALVDNVPWITALANDADFTQVFVEQLKNLAAPKDVLVAFSSSGNSRNVTRAIEWANTNGLVTVGVTGRAGGELARLAQHTIAVDSAHVGHVEEAHFLIQHLVSYYFVEEE